MFTFKRFPPLICRFILVFPGLKWCLKLSLNTTYWYVCPYLFKYFAYIEIIVWTKICIEINNNSYSWSELRNTRDVYSNKSDVFDNNSASRFGLEKAYAVPTADLLRAPISTIGIQSNRKWSYFEMQLWIVNYLFDYLIILV